MRYLAPITASVFLLFLVVVVCPTATSQVRGYFPNRGFDATVQDVSMVQLIAQPEEYDGKRVRVVAFLRIEFEGTALYLHREDYDSAITMNSLWIDIPHDMSKEQQEEVNLRYVICVAVFHAEQHSHDRRGRMANVQRLELWVSHNRAERK